LVNAPRIEVRGRVGFDHKVQCVQNGKE
jgi:hypothetical protein